MTGAEVDEMIEAENARIWEKLNEEDKAWEAAIEALKNAKEALDTAKAHLQEAAEFIEGRPETHRIGALEMAADDLFGDVKLTIERME